MESFKKCGMQKDYVETKVCDGIEFDVFIDDYGQSYYIQFLEDGIQHEESCGTYMMDIDGYIEWRREKIRENF